jgi:hypothetical protein
MRCPIRAIDKRTYEVHSKCEVDNNGGGEAKVATVSTTLMIVNHKTNWRYPVFILLGVDVHGRLLIAKVTPPGCPAKVCR